MDDMDQKPFLCDQSHEAFTSQDALTEHKLTEHQGKCLFICCHCKKVFTVEEELNEHIQANSCKYLDLETGAGTFMCKNIMDTDKKPHLCELCSEAFTDLDSFISHKEGHKKDKFFVCSECKRVFNVEEDLNNHLETHKTPHADITAHHNKDSNDKLNLLSETCSHLTTQNDVSLADVKTEKQQIKFPPLLGGDCTNNKSCPCGQCDESFTSSHLLMLHKIAHEYKEHTSDKAFVSIKELTKHPCAIFHSSQSKNEESTTVTTTLSSTRPHLEAHKNSETLETESLSSDDVHVKSKKFSPQSKGLLDLDITETHSLKKPYQCDQCQKGFTERKNLFRHLRTHGGKKPYECDQCHKTFTERKNLFRHERTHSGERPFKCDQCDKTFTQKHLLTIHIRTHSGDNPYQCDQCHKGFTQKKNLLQHLRAHSGEKPFKCDQCDRVYTKRPDDSSFQNT